MNDPKSLKLYIAVLDEVPDHMVPVLVAHAVMGADGFFATNEYFDWKDLSFKKVVLRVNRKEFDKISKLGDIYLAHENTTLDGEKSCAVVSPRYEIPNVLKFAKMWKPNEWTETANKQLQEVKDYEMRLASAQKVTM